MNLRLIKVASFLFGSGFCALIYQLAWLRQFRIIFGTSTAATAAVLGIFMGGLGFGSLILGRRADAKARPLRFYATLELLIAAAVALTPLLLWLIRRLYIATGGTMSLGQGGATVLRLILSAAVIGVPTFLMGGTAPAAVKAALDDADYGRKGVALLYGANTLGAVTGVLLATFLLFENLGNRLTLYAACALNIAVALAALWTARSFPVRQIQSAAPVETVPDRKPIFVLAAAAVVGFVFLLMEIVWYRMLGPLLGGSTFTFGVILALALLGIGVGSTAYSMTRRSRVASIFGFAVTCTLEALALAIPFALGDRLAILTGLLQPLGTAGFTMKILSWFAVAAIVVLPAAIIAGIQFPMLIGLLGRGRQAAGAHTGAVFAWNTAGAICGSLAGGFGILPLLSAPGAWRLAVVLLAVLGLAALARSWFSGQSKLATFLPLGAGAAAIAMLFALGPTAAWRHGAIGAGRSDVPTSESENDLREWVNSMRRSLWWDVDGVESSLGVLRDDSISFIVNGKSDGNARADAGTQVMCGLVPALLHPNATSALVIGLGSGSTAGWLAAIPSMQKVDVVELEPAILAVARACTPVNHNALENQKLNVIIGDGREIIQTTRSQYDVITSEPSNPYRAGVASLWTREFYQTVKAKLKKGGIFSQWVQGYEVDGDTIRTICATIGQEFPHVEIWQTLASDLLFVASQEPIAHDAAELKGRVVQEPFRSALANAWRVTTLEGVLSHYVAGDPILRELGKSERRLNTDDQTVLEYAFARTVGLEKGTPVEDLIRAAREKGLSQPALTNGQVDQNSLEEYAISTSTGEGEAPDILPYFSVEQRFRATAQKAFVEGELLRAWQLWRRQPAEPNDLTEIAMAAEICAEVRNEKSLQYLATLREYHPADADAILARLRWKQGRFGEATDALEAAFAGWRNNPWAAENMIDRTLEVAAALAETIGNENLVPRLYQAVSSPLSTFLSEDKRCLTVFRIAKHMPVLEREGRVLDAIGALEPFVPWQRDFLEARATAYKAANAPKARLAKHELKLYADRGVRPLFAEDATGTGDSVTPASGVGGGRRPTHHPPKASAEQP